MKFLGRVIIAVIVLLCLTDVDCGSKYSDETRPYEFGFNIKGEQHRHEKKDENGIIEGEFGFITADGVYHVTVYATDENGNFKILSMKNIRVRPYPTNEDAKKTAVKKEQSLPFTTPVLPSQPKPTPTQKDSPRSPKLLSPSPPKPIVTTKAISRPLASPARTCSHCSLPETTTRQQLELEVRSQFNSPNQNIDGNDKPVNNLNPASVQITRQNSNLPNVPQNKAQNKNVLQNPQQTNSYVRNPYSNNQNVPDTNQSFDNPAENYDGFKTNIDVQTPNDGKTTDPDINQSPYNLGKNSDKTTKSENERKQINSPNNRIDPQTSYGGAPPGQRNPKQYYPDNLENQAQSTTARYDTNMQNKRNKPILIAAQMQIVDPETDVNYREPGEKEGLPNGVTAEDIGELLYTFNYTVGFHAHHETGYTSGAKRGYYYVTGRNGVRTRVDYEADDKGFRPKITQEVLDIASADVPKEETEKDEKYGLKGYEFKWLYFPRAKN